ncbi:periplasmic heavy metal sensor [Pseudemcibacter aquimaris]|uniref:periplasmic heavy metal sensor n=1 Tax=Pseudemcibacter aquimaris TaxID=2857064 RepID=UPI00201280E9|nr:periplasmic heavy metal sensor [Pseudemcibacter aquimaris]MCC3860070.1 periplasmic heavy metal sensor [Pseudemcibacter aquimaris]WDU57399.1 periplasmic heavy metal sensor [Pseudemcibacter aquimaris]
MKNLSLKINWISIVMLLSLGVNFFVIGYLYAGHKAKELRMTRLSFDHSISKIVEPLPKSGKHEFYVTMKSKRADLIPIYKDIMAQRTAIMHIIAADQFDPAKFREAMDAYHNRYQSMIGESQEVMVKIVGGLSLEERKAVLERYKNPPKRSYRGRDGDRNRDRRRDDDDDNRKSSTESKSGEASFF